MKRLLIFFLCFFLGIPLCACQEKEERVPLSATEEPGYRAEAASEKEETLPTVSPLEAVFDGTGTFYSADHETDVTISEFCALWAEGSGVTVTMPKYAAADLDGDGEAERIFRVLINGVSEYGVLVLHDQGGKVYGFTFSERQLGKIKADGSFWYSGAQGSDGAGKLRFQDAGFSYTDVPLEHYDEQPDIAWHDYAYFQ